jgi:hypothetical protein
MSGAVNPAREEVLQIFPGRFLESDPQIFGRGVSLAVIVVIVAHSFKESFITKLPAQHVQTQAPFW